MDSSLDFQTHLHFPVADFLFDLIQ